MFSYAEPALWGRFYVLNVPAEIGAINLRCGTNFPQAFKFSILICWKLCYNQRINKEDIK